ncbi:MAG: hypothetical protein HFH32_17320 [Eubacterium sp.]|jgi:hypothetical protein|nr:hypothetical protein [Eubacterium sp.]
MKKHDSRFIYKSCMSWYIETDVSGMGKHKANAAEMGRQDWMKGKYKNG